MTTETTRTVSHPPPPFHGSVDNRHPITGSLSAFQRDPLAFMARLGAEQPGVAPFRLGPVNAVLVSGPEEFKQVLVSKAGDFTKGALQRRAIEPVLRRGLLIAEGELHKRQRKLLAPMFAGRKLPAYVGLLGSQAQQHADRLLDGERVDLLDVMGAITRDVIRTMLWTSSQADGEHLADAVTGAFEWEMHQLFSLAPAPPWVPTRRNLAMRQHVGHVRSTVARIIAERRADPGEHEDVLSQLLAAVDAGHDMDEDLLVDEVIALWGAAHETSADAQLWTAYLLARHPEVRDQVEAEADEVLGDRLPQPADLDRLPVASQVFREAMRLYPPAAAMLREAAVDTEVGGVPVRKGTLVFLSTFALHRNPELYPEPDRFLPERFTPAAEKARHRFAYLPFGAGPHVCIGSTLALMEGTVFTSVLARRVRFELDPPAEVQPQLLINLRPRGQVGAVVHRRRPRPTGDL